MAEKDKPFNPEQEQAQAQYLRHLKEYSQHIPFWQHIACKIEELEAGSCVLSLKVEPYHLNGSKIVHGGVIASLLDNAMGVAARSEAGKFFATTHMNVHYIAPGESGTLFARGRILHRAGRSVTAEARVENEDGTLLALATGTFREFPQKAQIEARME